MVVAALHGLGRFGQHLLHAWLQAPAGVVLGYAADEVLTGEAVCRLLREHDRLDFSATDPGFESGCLCLTRADGERVRLAFHHGPILEAPWLWQPDLWLECSGRYAAASACRRFAQGCTQQVLVAATSWDADQTLVMGYNHRAWQAISQVISYGSCTVNAFVPLAHWLHQTYGVAEARVNVVHNLPAYKIGGSPGPAWHECTLEAMAPQLLPWLQPEQMWVSYALIPYAGSSLIEMQWRLRAVPTAQQVRERLSLACAHELQGRYQLFEYDPGVAEVLGNPHNAVFHGAGVQVKGDVLRLQGYFDNENSAVRYLELVEWVAARLQQNAGCGFADGDANDGEDDV